MLAEDGGKREGDISEEYVRGLSIVLVAVLDVGEEGVDRVEGLTSAEASALSRGKQVVF